VHPSWIVPGGVNAPLDSAVRDRTPNPPRAALAERTIAYFKTVLDRFGEEIANFGTAHDVRGNGGWRRWTAGAAC
jgi:NAD-reducing hydrogenase large subunit